MRRIVLTVLLLYLIQSTIAQNIISGTVTDNDNNPLVGATVYIPEINKGATTNKQGEFSIGNLPNGNLTIRYSFIGFNTKAQKIALANTDTVVAVQLTVAVIQSQEVVVSGGYIGSQHENAIKIDVIKSKDIIESGTPNFMESLTKVPGVDMISKGQGVSKPVIRGLSMNNILVMNNGVRIENYQFSEDHPIGIDGSNITRVEVIKGPASLLYGSDAIGGVLNFISKTPAPRGKIVGNYLTQFYSNSLGINNSLGVRGANKNIFGSLRLSRKNHADYLQGHGNFVPNTRFNETTLNTDAGYTGKTGSFKLFYDFFKQGLGMSVPPATVVITERGRKNEVWFQDLSHHLLSSQNNLYFGNIKLTLNMSFQNALRKLKTNSTIPFIEMRLNTTTYESKIYLPSRDKMEYIFGIQGMAQNNRNLNNRESQFLPDANINNLGLIGLAKITLIKNLRLQGGLRFDTNKTETFALGSENDVNYHAPVNKSYSNLSGSLGATYSMNDKIYLRANAAKAYRVPNISELTSNGMHGNRYEIGNPDLLPQNSYETDFSIHYHSKFLSFDLALFYNNIDHYIFITPTADTTSSGTDIYKFAQTNATLSGGETGIHFHPRTLPWLHIQGTYSSVTGRQENGAYLPFIGAGKFRYEIRAGRKKIIFIKNPSVKLSALSALPQNKPSPYETATSGYTIVNLSVYSEVKISQQMVNFSISANNIFDTQYIDHLSTLKAMNYLNAGRNISISMKVPFTIK